jgi:hypothetical protein
MVQKLAAAGAGGVLGIHGLVCYPLLRLRQVSLVALLLVAVLVAWHPARVAAQTLLLLPAIFPNPPVDPLALVTSEPARTEHHFTYAAGTIDASIFHPPDGGQHGAVMLLPGAGELPREGEAVRFAEALARLGVMVMLPSSSGLRQERLTFAEIDGLRACYDVLLGQQDVDPERTGFVGLSAAGGLSIVAAAQPELRDRVRFINSFGSYYDATELLLDVSTHSFEIDGQERSWQPEVRTQEVVAKSLEELDDPAVTELLAGTTREHGRELIARLAPETASRLHEISPSMYLPQLRAHLYLMHDLDDPFIPFTESRALTKAAPANAVQRYTEFEIFAHVIPERPVPWQTFVPDVWRLFWHVQAVLMEVL